jgi:hypothetical protein
MMPQALLDEIGDKLQAGMSPEEIACTLGRRARLDHGEICSIRKVAAAMSAPATGVVSAR